MSKPTSNESMATLLSIPGEIRNTIYHLCLFPLSPSLLGLHFSHPKDVFYTLLRSPLFRTCRQIRAEVLSFLAATKDFRLPGIRTATTFLRYIGPIGRANLSHMTIALLSEQDVDVDGGKELVRFMRDIKGVGRRRVVVGIQTTVNMQDGVIGFLTALRESLEEGCEDMHVSWCLLENGLPAKASPQEVARNQTIAGLERALGKENMIKGTMWTLVDARRV
ncbi:hypothetical protein K504DRAFT_259715 [Pleomassaria siparia CBS 279.74]|uniref:F-box domain-containing protein n=1 Tax=Pleomassaria siparia CBS 279.74 TaxID=1314801 RepID=A0A6G1KBV6_9PLEO|nr:hypothetical protein K504DRAFT_259715 [Pleomassaria siparia CBS 279.74]